MFVILREIERICKEICLLNSKYAHFKFQSLRQFAQLMYFLYPQIQFVDELKLILNPVGGNFTTQLTLLFIVRIFCLKICKKNHKKQVLLIDMDEFHLFYYFK